MKIEISGGEIQIDSAYLQIIKDHSWYVARQKGKQKIYVCAHLECGNGKYRLVRLHRFLLREPAGTKITHSNGDGCDNRRANLVVIEESKEITRHSRKWAKPVSSAYKGVSWNKRMKKWRANIVANRKQITLGAYSSEIEAAHAYDKAATKLFDLPRLIFPNEK